ncbi:MAG: SMP-30/gluconolactonase/LRE family protein [Acidobacteria bacterium]|nr:SMP-30/gluconolactonase/LRE family protein [Acidobacteriota bacterium]
MERFLHIALLILFAGVSLFAYNPRRMGTPAGIALEKWADSAFPVSWRLNLARGGNITGARDLTGSVRSAFASWSAVPTASVSFAEGASATIAAAALDGVNLVSFAPAVFPSEAVSLTVLYSFSATGTDTLGRAILFPGQILEADILFNPGTLFSTDPAPASDRIDLESRLRHEIGHFLGLDHSGLLSAVMFPNLDRGVARSLSVDDQIGLSSLYPASTFWTSRGSVRGQVVSPAGTPVYGAHVVVLDTQGKPVASTVTGPDGEYQIPGLEPGNYSAYAEPQDGPFEPLSIETLGLVYPNQTVRRDFTTRFGQVPGSASSTFTLVKTAGDNQTGTAGQALPTLLEIEVRNANNTAASGVRVTFGATSGGGAIVPIEAATDAQGRARTRVYLGTGQSQTFTASVSGATVTFAATAQPRSVFSIIFLDPDSNTRTREIVVNEGNMVAPRLRVLDSTGQEQIGVPISYMSLNSAIATVDSSGMILGRRAGFSTLTVTAGGVVATATITVVQVGAGVSGQTAGIASDLANRLYLASSQNHTVLLAQDIGQAPAVYAGTHQTAGRLDAARLDALFNTPSFLAFNQADGSLYVSDAANHLIRQIQAGPAGRVETIAGTGTAGNQDGPALMATFNNPQGLALDDRGNLWVVDSGNHTIRKIDLSTRTVTTVAGQAGGSGSMDGTGNQARFNSPAGIALEAESLDQELDRFRLGRPREMVRMVIADRGNGLLRRVRDDGAVETLRRSTAAAAVVDEPKELALNPAALPIQLTAPTGIAVDPLGNIFATEPGSGTVKTILRNGDVVPAAQTNTFTNPTGIVVGQHGRILVSDASQTAARITYGEPTISSVTPNRVSDGGGTQVIIRGDNFAPDTFLVAAGLVISNFTVNDSQTFTFTTPQLPSGRTTITLQNRGGLAQTSILVYPAPLSELPPGRITTVAGGTTFLGDGSAATSAALASAGRIALDAAGNLYIADSYNNRIRKVAAKTGVITTVAGTGVFEFDGDGGPATTARLAEPNGVAVDLAGNLFIADTGNHRIRRVDAATGFITTFAGNGQDGFAGDGRPATEASFVSIGGMAFDRESNLFVADRANARVRKIDATTQHVITTVAGTGQLGFSGDNGPAIQAQLDAPTDVAVDRRGNLFIADLSRIRRVDAATGIITTVAGRDADGYSGDGGLATAATLNGASNGVGIRVDDAGNLIIADTGNNRIRKVDATTQNITTIAGTGAPAFSGDNGPATDSGLTTPVGAIVDGAGNLLIADFGNSRIRKVDARTGIISTFAGSGPSSGDGGPATEAYLDFPASVAVDRLDALFVGENYRVRRVDPGTGIIRTFVGTGQPGVGGDGGPATQAPLNEHLDIAVDAGGNLYVVDAHIHQVRKIDAGSAVITTVAGVDREPGSSGDGGLASAAKLNYPAGVAVDASGNIYISDSENHRIRRVDAVTRVITTFAGNGVAGFSGDGGVATNASLQHPQGIAVDSEGNLFIADMINRRIRRVDALSRSITTVAGTGLIDSSGDGGLAKNAGLVRPTGVALDRSGNLFIADYYKVRRVNLASGIITTVAGTGGYDFNGDNGPATQAQAGAVRLAVDSAGNLYLADRINRRIRAVREPIP